MDKRIQGFNKYFKRWEISLPNDIESRSQHGQIVDQGWTIKFLFGEDCQGKYLDFYAAHRMTNDRHVRIRSNGSEKTLPALDGMRIVYKDPEEDAKSQREWAERTSKTMQMLEEKGFGISGSEHGSFVINTHLLKQALEKGPNSPKN